MAILYGTTADGETLPVEVNEFGQLIAEGLPGQPGPPGPPGIGQLPPDPFEGAILGWKDNTLAWLGGSVPLPEGTYGPILGYADGVLTLETSVDLPYLTEVNLSDAEGTTVFFSYSSSLISDVQQINSGPIIKQIENFGNRRDLMAGLTVSEEKLILTDDIFAPWEGNTNSITGDQLLPGGENRPVIWSSEVDPTGNLPTPADFGMSESRTATAWRSYRFPGIYTAISWNGNAGGEGTTRATIQIPGQLVTELSFVDSFNLDQFAIGMLVQSPDVVITSIDVENSKVAVSGGSWFGSNGTGTPGGETRMFSSDVSGAGTVQTTINDTIVLRSDNGHWLVGGYVTAPQQKLAARYVYADEVRKKLM